MTAILQHGEALEALSSALKVATTSNERLSILISRSMAFTEMATWLKGIPAKESEKGAIYGLDPTTLAQLSLSDATKAVALEGTACEAYVQQGAALCHLERYTEAEQAIMKGLEVEPSYKALQSLLQSVRKQLANSRPPSPACPQESKTKRRKASAVDDAECSLCIKLLFEPVTTPCGHSFCKVCFLRAMDHNSRCPICRTVLHVGREIPVTLALRQIIESTFPEEYAARRREEQGPISQDTGPEAPLPLFVMTAILPGERMRLNIFEPRYRLMIRRCMEGSRRFGMATVTAAGGLHKIACEGEIIECQPVPDGRYLLEVVGRRRFRVAEDWEQDGYRMARPVYVYDDAASPAEAGRLHQLAMQAAEKTNEMITRLRSRALSTGNAGMELFNLLRLAGDGPDADYEHCSFWCANLVVRGRAERLWMLDTTSTSERLSRIVQILGSA